MQQINENENIDNKNGDEEYEALKTNYNGQNFGTLISKYKLIIIFLSFCCIILFAFIIVFYCIQKSKNKQKDQLIKFYRQIYDITNLNQTKKNIYNINETKYNNDNNEPIEEKKKISNNINNETKDNNNEMKENNETREINNNIENKTNNNIIHNNETKELNNNIPNFQNKTNNKTFKEILYNNNSNTNNNENKESIETINEINNRNNSIQNNETIKINNSNDIINKNKTINDTFNEIKANYSIQKNETKEKINITNDISINLNVSNNSIEINNNITNGKRKIYVKYMDFWPAFVVDNFDVHKILLEKYEVIFTEQPDYIVFSEFGGENRYFNCVKLFLSIENRDPDFSITDYAIGIHYINDRGDRYFRKPTEVHQLSAIYSIYNVTQTYRIDIKNKKFCSFVVSNPAGEARNKFFHKLSEYKRVDSGGSHLNNIGGRVENKKEFLKNYKFNICFENSKTQGYISEKLSDAFEAGTIPIYYGDDTVLELLNNKSYIHIKDESEFDEKIELIKKIDQNDTLYEQMIKEKIVIDDSRYPKELQKYKDFIYHIFDQDIEKARRIEK